MFDNELAKCKFEYDCDKMIESYLNKRTNAKCTSCQYWFTCDKQDQSKLECEWYKQLKIENYKELGK